MRLADLDVQKSCYTLLRSDLSLQSLIGLEGVADMPRTNASYPFVLIGEASEVSSHAHSRSGSVIEVSMDVWTKSKTFKSAKTIANRIVELLDHKSLVIPSWFHVWTHLTLNLALRDPDRELRRVSLRFNVFVQEVVS